MNFISQKNKDFIKSIDLIQSRNCCLSKKKAVQPSRIIITQSYRKENAFNDHCVFSEWIFGRMRINFIQPAVIQKRRVGKFDSDIESKFQIQFVNDY